MSQPALYSQIFIPPEDIGDDILGVPLDVQQLREDSINVLEGRVDIRSFDLAYQEKIRGYYKFSATRYGSKYGLVAARTTDTLDII